MEINYPQEYLKREKDSTHYSYYYPSYIEEELQGDLISYS